jgi:hypothetical protein
MPCADDCAHEQNIFMPVAAKALSALLKKFSCRENDFRTKTNRTQQSGSRFQWLL